MNIKGNVDVPVVGHVDKRVLLGVGAAGAVFVGWKYWQSRSAAAYDPGADAVDPGMEDPGALPSVSGAVRDDNGYGLPGDNPNTSDSYGFKGTTNSQWTQYAAGQLSQGSDNWSYSTIATALGKFIANKALSTEEQNIVQAAIAVAGYPPEGSHVIVPGGDTKVTVAPTGLKVTATTSSSVSLAWSPVAGAQSYRVYRSGSSSNVGATDAPNTTFTVGGLEPGKEYSFQVAADSLGDVPGPKSTAIKGKTKAATLKAPTGLKATSTKTSVSLHWTPVSGADSYRAYRYGVAQNVGSSRDASMTIPGLRANTSYKFKVAAVAGPTTGPGSSWVSIKTKK